MTRPPFPDLPLVASPVAILGPETVDAALAAMAAIDEQGATLRRFLREGAEYRRATGRAVPVREWDAAHDRIHDLARQRQHIQAALGRFRRTKRDADRSLFERAFVEEARGRLPGDLFAELTAGASARKGRSS